MTGVLLILTILVIVLMLCLVWFVWRTSKYKAAYLAWKAEALSFQTAVNDLRQTNAALSREGVKWRTRYEETVNELQDDEAVEDAIESIEKSIRGESCD